jgi:hypothetical protein
MKQEITEISNSKQYKKVVKLLGEAEAQRIINKSVQDLKELVAVNSAFIQSRKTEMEQSSKFSAATETLKECKDEFKAQTTDTTVALQLAILALSQKV